MYAAVEAVSWYALGDQILLLFRCQAFIFINTKCEVKYTSFIVNTFRAFHSLRVLHHLGYLHCTYVGNVYFCVFNADHNLKERNPELVFQRFKLKKNYMHIIFILASTMI